MGCPVAMLPTVLCTVTSMVQLLAAARLATVGLTCVPPTVSTGANVTPAHVPAAVAFDTVMFASVSVNATLVSAAVGLGLATVKRITVVPFTRIGLVTKALVSVGPDSTRSVAVLEAGPAVGVCVVVMPPVVLL